jgi:hypothetical protein
VVEDADEAAGTADAQGRGDAASVAQAVDDAAQAQAADDAAQAPAAGPDDPTMDSRARRRAVLGRPYTRLLTLAWIPLVASAISVVLSLTSIYISTRQPEVLMLLPEVIRVAGGRVTGGSYAYLQPTFVSTGANERVEVIRDVQLTLAPVDAGDPAQLTWKEQVELVGEGGELSYRHLADAVPLLVGPRNAAGPIGLFQAPAGWFLEAGTYDATLTAARVVGTDPLVAHFRFSIPPADLAILDDTTRERFVTYPITAEQ